MKRLVIILSFWALFGCSGRTGAIVHVATDLGPEVFDRYFIRVEGDGTRSMFGPYLRKDVDPNPSFGIAPRGGDPTRSALIIVQGHLDQRLVVTTEMMLPSFIKGQIMELHMFLGARPGDDAGVPADAKAPTDADLSDADQEDVGLSDAGDSGMPLCPADCTSCDPDGTCVFNCASGECNAGVTCPPGRACRVNCVGDKACESGRIDCSMATSCAINCIGTDACDTGGIVCGGDVCTVVCQGGSACEEGQIQCDATRCDIVCDGGNACNGRVCCGNNQDCQSCTSVNGGCCSCAAC